VGPAKNEQGYHGEAFQANSQYERLFKGAQEAEAWSRERSKLPGSFRMRLMAACGSFISLKGNSPPPEGEGFRASRRATTRTTPPSKGRSD